MVGKTLLRRALAVAVAGAAHLGLFTALVLGRRPEPHDAQPPVMQVTLTAPPLRELAPPPRRAGAKTSPSALGAPADVPPPAGPVAPTTAPAPADGADLAAAVGAAAIGQRLRARRKCLEDTVTADDLDACAEFYGRAAPPLSVAPGGSEDKQAALARAAARKAAIRRYRETRSDETYPGLLCIFSSGCDAK